MEPDELVPEHDMTLAESVVHFATAQRQLAAALHQLVRWLRISAGIVVVTLGVLIYLTVANRNTLRILESATTPRGEIYQRGQTQQQDALLGLRMETDCITRRALAGLPAPLVPRGPDGKPNFADPLVSCISQTTSDVYPGG